MPDNPIRSYLNSVAHQVLARLAEKPELGRAGDTAVVFDEGHEVYISILPHPGPRQAGPDPGLTPAERKVLAAATDQPQTARALARKAKLKSLSYVRAAIKSLCAKGLLERADHDTYRLARQRGVAG